MLFAKKPYRTLFLSIPFACTHTALCPTIGTYRSMGTIKSHLVDAFSTFLVVMHGITDTDTEVQGKALFIKTDFALIQSKEMKHSRESLTISNITLSKQD